MFGRIICRCLLRRWRRINISVVSDLLFLTNVNQTKISQSVNATVNSFTSPSLGRLLPEPLSWIEPSPPIPTIHKITLLFIIEWICFGSHIVLFFSNKKSISNITLLLALNIYIYNTFQMTLLDKVNIYHKQFSIFYQFCNLLVVSRDFKCYSLIG